LSEHTNEEFWQKMLVAAQNEVPTPIGGRWPRAAERRHFRGKQATSAVNELWERYNSYPEAMVRYIAGLPSGPYDFQSVTARAKEHRGFGDWISFKIADMLECLDIAPVTFQLSDAMYDSPTKAAERLARQRLGLPEGAKLKDGVVESVVRHLLDTYANYPAPPNHVRLVGYQEVETILCKHGSHLNGHYPLGKDTHEITEGVKPWTTHSQTARELLHHLPKDGHQWKMAAA
jgi:hypothetical protein